VTVLVKHCNSDADHDAQLIVCQPELEDEDAFHLDDQIRQCPTNSGSDLAKLWNQRNMDWHKIGKNRMSAVTEADAEDPPTGDRAQIPSAIYLSPALLRWQRSKGFVAWTDEIIEEVTKPGAGKAFKDKSPEEDLRPVDKLYIESLERLMFHEVRAFRCRQGAHGSVLTESQLFHLRAFGNMFDEGKAYGLANNRADQNKENPDYLAIIATNIYLLKDKNLVVNKEGEVTKG
jgi:hypothetical protein